jgi:UDP-N-acetylmuramate--alanine ligase
VYSKQQTEPLGTLTLTMPGRHNMLNALAAIAVARDLDVDFDTIAIALKSFKGIERRFSYKGMYKGAELFDDYGHHPTEIFNALLVARKRAARKLIVIFQPQRYTRTHKLWHEFINVLAYSPIDYLAVTDIYPASEDPIEGITGENLAQALQYKQPSCNVSYVPYDTTGEQITEYIKTSAREGDLVLFLGAGKINKLIDKLIQE